MSSESPIGIFDSGVGGLSVADQICKKLPRERFVYLGDQLHVPYGERSPEEIRYFALSITDFLLRQDAKMVIMACNVSSALVLDAARELFTQAPIIGVIDAGVRAAARIASSKVGVLATTGTAKSGAYMRGLKSIDPSIEVFQQPCPGFVPLVESGMCDTPEAEATARKYVEPLIEAGCDTLVLGCTHYPFLTGVIAGIAGPDVRIIDPAEETALEAANILGDAGTLNPSCFEPAQVYYTSGCPDSFAGLGGRLLGRPIRDVRTVDWGSELGEIAWQETMVAQTTNSAR